MNKAYHCVNNEIYDQIEIHIVDIVNNQVRNKIGINFYDFLMENIYDNVFIKVSQVCDQINNQGNNIMH